MTKRRGYALVVSMVIALSGCSSLSGGNSGKDEYKEIPLSALEESARKSGRYVVRMNPENHSRFTYDQYHYERMGIDGLSCDLGDLVEEPEYEQLGQRLHYTQNAAFYLDVTSSLFSYECKITRIEGLISLEDMKALVEEGKAAEARQKTAQEEERRAALTKKRALVDESARALAGGYIYHGIDEEGRSATLFNGAALQEGHAYYLSNIILGSAGETAGILSLVDEPTYQLVDYVNQELRSDIIVASKTITGSFGLAVVVTAGKGPLRIPVIIGLVE